MYHVECGCGQQIPVELYQAGTKVECPGCRQPVAIPSSTKLKTASGDKHPLLSPLEKVAIAASAKEFPFQGACHKCQANEAAFATPIEFKAMIERVILKEGGIRPISLSVFVLTTGESEEQWVTVRFPLLLCGKCQSEFALDHKRSGRKGLFKNVIMFGLLALFLYLVYLRPEAVVAIAGLLSLVGMVAWVANLRGTKKGETFLSRWLGGIRWVPEMIQSEQEYSLTAGHSEPIRRATNVTP